MGIFIIVLICILIWKGWGVVFDGKPNPIKEIKVSSRNRLQRWLHEAEEVLRNPDSSVQQREDAIRDIEYFSRVLRNDFGVEV